MEKSLAVIGQFTNVFFLERDIFSVSKIHSIAWNHSSLFHCKQIIHCYLSDRLVNLYIHVLCNNFISHSQCPLYSAYKIENFKHFLISTLVFWFLKCLALFIKTNLILNHENRMSIFSTKNYVCFDEIQHARYWYNGILKTSHEHSTMQFDNIFFLCRSFIFSVHCCVYINILNTFLYFDYLYKNKTFKPVYDMDILYAFKVIWSVWDCTVSRGSFDCIVYTDLKKNIYNKFKWKVMYDSKRYCSSF